jgi:soluble lytic murein transglycosylase
MRALVQVLLALLCAAASPGGAATAVDEPDSAPARRPAPFDQRWLEPHFGRAPASMQAAVERFRLEDWSGATKALTAALAKLPKSSTDRLPGRYLLALSRMNQGEWEAAGKIFEELHASYPLLAPYHAYYAARCRLRRGDTAGAITWAGRVAPRTVPEAEAILVKIDALVSEKRWGEVETEAGRFLERFPSGPRRAEATFRRAEALEALQRPTEAVSLYQRIWAEAPSEAWAHRASERLEALAAAAPAAEGVRLRAHPAADWVQRGMVLFDRNQNAESEAAFGGALTAPGLDAPLECKARFHRAQSVWKQRQRSRAVPLFKEAETACRGAGDSDLLVKSMYQGARCLASTGDGAAAVALYTRIESEFPQHNYADDARLRAAEVAADKGDEAQVTALLKEIPDRYPQGDLVGESLWRLAFRSWRAGAWAEARGWLDENLRRVPREEVWYAEGRAHYWKGRIFEKENKPEEAKAAYTRAVRDYPLSVYALLSLERLRRGFPEAREALIRELRAPLAEKTEKGQGKTAKTVKTEKGEIPGAEGWKFAPRPVFAEPAFLRAVELARMGLGPDARRELARLGFAAPESRDAARKAAAAADTDREDIFWITAILLDRGRLWSASHSIPRYTLTSYRLEYPGGRRATEWRIAYPRAFPELVTKNSRLNQVPEALQLAIMREESAFNPRIESFANALGLTQMVVRTAQRFASHRVSRDTLLDPSQNLELGSKFLSFLLQRYGGAVPLAIAGYNAGEGAVDKWLKEHADMELDEFLESIPYDETRNYTKRVMASFATYSWLYFPEQPVPPLAFTLTQPIPSRSGRPAPAHHRR